MVTIVKNKEGGVDFSIVTESGKTLVKGTGLTNESDVRTLIDRMSAQQERFYKVARKTDHNGRFHFSVLDKEGSLIAQSGTYGSEAGMENGIKNFKNSIAQLGPS
ncbi:MAG: YegP family protein [Flavobacteriaceae bacterium]